MDNAAMSRKDDFLAGLLARLAGLDGLRSRAMFGGWGLYAGATFFGIVYRGRLYLHTTAATRGGYTSRGSGPFRPSAKQTLWDYYEVPADVLADEATLLEWARAAVEGRR
jgi:DNA transformation protein